MEFLVTQRMEQRVVVDLDGNRVLLAAINNAGNFSGVAQAAARTRALQFARLRNDF